ncbi:MAG: hypothetical protein M0Z49_01735 [Chloroflexi bacterium]|nr:hypothetical protein [Chloroflexota bacterium]
MAGDTDESGGTQTTGSGSSSPASTWTRIDYPAQFAMPVDEFASRAEWRVRRMRGAVWVRTIESYESRRPDLFRLTKLADASTAARDRSWEPLAKLREQDSIQSPDLRLAISNLREVREPTQPEDPLVAFRLQFMTVPDEAVATFAQQTFVQMITAWPAAGAWLVEFADALQGRLGAARALFAAGVTPLNLELAPVSLRLFPAGLSFMRSQLLGFPAYLEPALLTLSPWLAGISSYRVGGSLVFLFGVPLPGLRQGVQAPEPIDVFRAHSYVAAETALAPSSLPASSAEAGLRWWVQRLNDLFALALDPASYRDVSGAFVPARQIGVLMSLERLFISLQTILTQPREDFVRSLLLFDVLDVLDGLGFDDWNRMVTLRNVESALTRLESRLPADARPWLLPRCAEAVDALRVAVDGFSPAYVDEDFVQLPSKSGAPDRVARDRAYALLLRLTRNASHSYQKHARDPREVALLATHDGRVPARLAHLALLHVLRFMDAPRLPT